MLSLPFTFTYFLFINLVCTLFMTGVIYYLQFAHYPLYYQIREDISDYTAKDLWRTGMIIYPIMIIETLTSIWLTFDPVFPSLDLYFDAAVFLVVILWLSTLFIQLPAQRKLLDGYSEKAIRFLIQSNWIRVIGWTLRTLIMIYLLYRTTGKCLPH